MATINQSTQEALKRLVFELERLPVGTRRGLEEDFMVLTNQFGQHLPEAQLIASYRELRTKITAARFERAKAEILASRSELYRLGGGVAWNKSSQGVRLAKWLQGYEESGFQTVEGFFKEASDLDQALDRAIYLASRPKRAFGAPRPYRPDNNREDLGNGTKGDLLKVNQAPASVTIPIQEPKLGSKSRRQATKVSKKAALQANRVWEK